MSELKNTTNWWGIAIGYLSLFALGLLDTIRSPFYPDLSSELNLSDSVAALFFVTTSTMAFLSGLFVPYAISRWRVLYTLRFGLLLITIGFIILAKAPNLLILLVGSALFGFGFGIINVAQNILIMESASGQRRRRLLSGLHGMYALAALTAPIVAAQFFHLQLNWRQAFLMFSFVGLIVFIFSLIKGPKLDMGSVVLPLNTKSDVTSRRQLWPRDMSRYLQVGIMLSLYIISEVLIGTRYPMYLRRVFELSAEDSANYLALFFVFLLLGRLLFLTFDSRLSNILIIEICLVLSFIFNLLGLFVHPILLTLCGLTMAPIFGLSIDYIATRYKENANEAVSICVTLSGIFLVMMHYLIGVTTQIFGVHIAMYFGCISLAGSWLVLKSIKQK